MRNARMSFVLLVTVLFVGLCTAVAEPSKKLTQTELDRIVETEGMRFIHGYDWRSWVDNCKRRGATDDMFVAAFSKIAQRTMNAEDGSDDAYKCKKSISLINEFNTAASNLATVVQVVKQAKSSRVRSTAVSTYYKHTKGTEEYLGFAEDILLSESLQPEVEAWVMTGLWHDARGNQHKKGNWGKRVTTLMRQYVSQDVRGLDSADEILKWTDASYANSPLRRDIRRRILSPGYREAIDRYRGRSGEGQRIQMKYRREEEEENKK